MAGPTAAEVRTAKRIFTQAEQDEASGHWAEAVEKLEQVLAIKETAGVRYHLANCQEHLNEFLKAQGNYERARVLAEEGKVADVLTMVRARLESLRAKTPSIILVFRPQPKPQELLEITVDSNLVESNQAISGILTDPGLHRLLVHLNGNVVLDRSVLSREGAAQTLLVELSPSISAAPASSAPAVSPTNIDATKQQGTSSLTPLAWVSFGTAAALGVGGYFAFQHAGNVASESSTVCAQSLSCDPQRAKVVRGWDMAAIGMWAGAAGALGVGVFSLTVPSKERPRAASLVLGPGRVEVGGSF